MSLSVVDIPVRPDDPKGWKHIFRARGEGAYSLELLPIGITLYVDRLRRDRHELIGEMTVTCNGEMPQARTVEGVLSAGDLNFSSVQARGTRAKILAERSRTPEIDWTGLVEEFYIKTLAAERAGTPAVILADIPEQDESTETWTLGGWQVLSDLPMILFGDASAGKSYFALWIAGLMATELGLNVLYADWEF